MYRIIEIISRVDLGVEKRQEEKESAPGMTIPAFPAQFLPYSPVSQLPADKVVRKRPAYGGKSAEKLDADLWLLAALTQVTDTR